MYLLWVALLRRRVLQWLVPLISLWVAMVVGLAFSGASAARAAGAEPHSHLSPGGIPRGALNLEQAAYSPGYSAGKNSVNDAPPVRNTAPAAHLLTYSAVKGSVDEAVPHERLSLNPTTVRTTELHLANGEPGLVANAQLATVRTTAALLIDGDPSLPASDLLPTRAAISPPKLPLFVGTECQTPMSLMLHSSFGAERMRLLAREILVQGLRTITYREVTAGLRRGECPGSNLIIVSLDDFGTDWLRAHFQSMIRTFTDRGLRLVVAVNVHGPQDPAAWTYLRELEALGNEVANHTIDHYNLARLEEKDVRRQVKGAHQTICLNLGRCPETLILPFGIIDGGGTVLSAAAGYSYVVGIPGGRSFVGEPPYYLGRIGPDNTDQRTTLAELVATFSNQPSEGAKYLAFRARRGRGCAAGPSPTLALPLAFCMPSAAQSSLTALNQAVLTSP